MVNTATINKTKMFYQLNSSYNKIMVIKETANKRITKLPVSETRFRLKIIVFITGTD